MQNHQFLVIDYGQVVYSSPDEVSASLVLANRRRGVLCSVLRVCATEFVQPEVAIKPRPIENGNRKK